MRRTLPRRKAERRCSHGSGDEQCIGCGRDSRSAPRSDTRRDSRGCPHASVAECHSARAACLSPQLSVFLVHRGCQQRLDAGSAARTARAQLQARRDSVPRAVPGSRRRGAGLRAADAARRRSAGSRVHRHLELLVGATPAGDRGRRQVLSGHGVRRARPADEVRGRGGAETSLRQRVHRGIRHAIGARNLRLDGADIRHANHPRPSRRPVSVSPRLSGLSDHTREHAGLHGIAGEGRDSRHRAGHEPHPGVHRRLLFRHL